MRTVKVLPSGSLTATGRGLALMAHALPADASIRLAVRNKRTSDLCINKRFTCTKYIELIAICMNFLATVLNVIH